MARLDRANKAGMTAYLNTSGAGGAGGRGSVVIIRYPYEP